MQVIRGRTGDEVHDALLRMVESGALCAESAPQMYVYRTTRAGHRQAGIVALVAHGDLDGRSSPAPPWAEPGTVLFDDPDGRIALLVAEDMNERPIFHFNASDGTTHTGWLIGDAARYVRAFAALSGRGELCGPAPEGGDGLLLAVLLERSATLHPPVQPRCGLFVQRSAMAANAS